MTDDEILKRCEDHLKIKKSIPISWSITRILNIKDESTVRRIRSLLLQNDLYTEDSVKERDGYFRIIFNPKYAKPKLSEQRPYLDWAIKGFISAIITTGIGLLIALPKFQRDTQQNKQQDSLIQILNTRVDSLMKRN
jgi:hypothetical protein